MRELQARGHTAYWAGGCVRDRLLGRPAADVDVATSATPDEVQATFRKTVPVGVQFGIVRVRLHGTEVEVATFRADGDYSDGRRPDSVRFTDAAEDAQRRDFTVNGLFLDPLAGSQHDFVEGLPDLRLGLVRAIGDPRARFEEDKLRILRAPRFAAVLGFGIEAETERAAQAMAPEIVTAQVAQERIHTELSKILTSGSRARGIALCQRLELLPHVLPEAVSSDEAFLLGFRTLLELPEPLPAPGLPLAWAALLWPAGPETADAALTRLRASNRERRATVALVRALTEAPGFASLSLAGQKRAAAEPQWQQLAPLLTAATLAGQGDLGPVHQLSQTLAAFAQLSGPTAPRAQPLIMGTDLLELGVPPGPRVGELLKELYDAQLEGTISTREEGLQLARERGL